MSITSNVFDLVLSTIPLPQDRIEVRRPHYDCDDVFYLRVNLRIADPLPPQEVTLGVNGCELYFDLDIRSEYDDSYKHIKYVIFRIEDPLFTIKMKECWRTIINSYMIYHIQDILSYDNPKKLDISSLMKELA